MISDQSKSKSKKKFGQYYTPTYIVDYIIDCTIGNSLKFGSEKIFSLKILDPACGKGIFLVRALSFLSSYLGTKISSEGQRSIIANQLYGIDIDPTQIVETQKNLNCLDFNVNFKTFNALIPPPSFPFQFDCSPLERLRSKFKKDFIDGNVRSINIKEQLKITQIENRIAEVLRRRLTNEFGISLDTVPMPWEIIFPETSGRFDIIIGNPPWGANIFSSELFSSYNVGKQQFDSWSLFIERSLKALNEDGHLGFVIPNTLLLNENYVEIRKFILDTCKIKKIVNLGGNIFPEITQPSMIIILEKSQPPPDHKIEVIRHIPPYLRIDLKSNQKSLSTLPTLSCTQGRFFNNNAYQFDIFLIGYEELKEVIEKDLNNNKIHVKPLGDLVTNARGVELNKNGRIVQCSSCGWWSSPPSHFHTEDVKAKQCANPKCREKVTQHDKMDFIVFDNQKHPERDKPFLVGQHIQRYFIKKHKYIDTTRTGIKYKDPALYQEPKLLLRKTGYGIKTAIDYDNRWVNQVVYFFKLKKKASIPLEYLMCVLNSKLINKYFFIEFADPYRQDFPHFTQKKFLCLPIRIPTTDRESNLVRIISNDAKTLQSLYQKKNSLVNQEYPDKGLNIKELDQKIREFENEINNLIFDLYEITPDLQKILN
ncbi:MAG: N-6 DNA methylase [Promethearchaeota archaeon]